MTSATSKKINLKALMNGPDVTLKQNYLRMDFWELLMSFLLILIVASSQHKKKTAKTGAKNGPNQGIKPTF